MARTVLPSAIGTRDFSRVGQRRSPVLQRSSPWPRAGHPMARSRCGAGFSLRGTSVPPASPPSSTEAPWPWRATQSNEDAGTAGGTGLTTGGDQGSALSRISRPCFFASGRACPGRARLAGTLADSYGLPAPVFNGSPHGPGGPPKGTKPMWGGLPACAGLQFPMARPGHPSG